MPNKPSSSTDEEIDQERSISSRDSTKSSSELIKECVNTPVDAKKSLQFVSRDRPPSPDSVLEGVEEQPKRRSGRIAEKTKIKKELELNKLNNASEGTSKISEKAKEQKKKPQGKTGEEDEKYPHSKGRQRGTGDQEYVPASVASDDGVSSTSHALLPNISNELLNEPAEGIVESHSKAGREGPDPTQSFKDALAKKDKEHKLEIKGKDGEINALKKEVQQYKRETENKDGEINALKKEVQQYKKEIESKDGEIKALKDDVQSRDKEIEVQKEIIDKAIIQNLLERNDNVGDVATQDSRVFELASSSDSASFTSVHRQ